MVTHPRSGTHLTIDLLRRNLPALATKKRLLEPLDALYVPVDLALQPGVKGHRKVRQLIERHQFPILKTHWMLPDYSNVQPRASDIHDWLATKAKRLYVIRNPRKVIASHYLFQLSFQQPPANLDGWLIHASRSWVNHVKRWHGLCDITIRFEDIISDPAAVVHDVGALVNETPTLASPILPPRLRSKWVGRWRRCFSRRSPSTEIMTPNQGASFDSLFAQADIREFLKIVGPVCKEWGYANAS